MGKQGADWTWTREKVAALKSAAAAGDREAVSELAGLDDDG